MARDKNMSLSTRKKELIRLIEDGEDLGFGKEVLIEYKTQLAEIESQLKEIAEARKRFKNSA